MMGVMKRRKARGRAGTGPAGTIGRERCAIAAQRHYIETLNDLFTALFRAGEGATPVIRQPQRPVREEIFALFFPDELVRLYADKSKSNLTWFFNNDPRNKSVRRSLAGLLAQAPRTVVAETHRKCHEALWPTPGWGLFDEAALREVLFSAKVGDALNSRWHILEGSNGRPALLETYCQADISAALARIILTLAVGEDASDAALAEIWRTDAGDSCEFMRRDGSPEGEMRYCRMLDLQGRRERAYAGFERIAKQLDRPARTRDEAAMYCRLGEMLFTGEGCLRDEQAALRYDRLACLEAYPRAYYQLGRHATGTAAREAMERAMELGYGPAIRELGTAWYNGSARLACVRNAENARRCFQAGLTLPGEDGAYCAYMLGQIYEGLGDRSAAVSAYRVAQENGSAEAGEKLARLDWVLEPGERERGAADGTLRYCLMNELTGCNRLFFDGLEGRWSVTVCGQGAEGLPHGVKAGDGDPVRALRELAQGVYWGGAPQFPELVIALLSEDRRRNLYQAVALLGELQRLALSLGERAWDLVDQVRLYVLAEREYGALLLDAAFGGMKELYFKVRLCDPAQDAADRLFAAAPLFLPRLRGAEDAPVRLKLIGCGEAAMAVLRRAIALPMPEGALSIDVYGDDAEAMERRFRQLCPGLFAADASLRGELPRFHPCALEEDLLRQLDEAGEESLGNGNYYVLAGEDDGENLRLGALLRTGLLRREGGCDQLPFIAVSVRNPMAGWLAESLAAGPEAPSPHWYNRCELFPFGSLSMYAPHALRQEALERRAEQVHMLFIGLPNTRDARHAAMGSYYRRQASRETARLTALSLVYRAHLAGVNLPGWRLYGTPDEEARLGDAYTRWLKEPEHLQAALRDEHARRCRALLVQGWAPATVEQVSAGARRGNPGHVLYPAKLHPFICPWEALESGELLKQVRQAVRAWFPEKSVPDPRRDEEASVRDTGRLLDGA